MAKAGEEDVRKNLILFKAHLAAYGDSKLVEKMTEVDIQCKALETPEYEDEQKKFISELDEAQEFECEDFSDDDKGDKKDQSDSDNDDSDVDVKPKVDDEYGEELETSQYDYAV